MDGQDNTPRPEKFGGPHMADYKGNTCPVCKQKFKEADDIVVCPDCGTREALDSIGVKPDEQEQIIASIHRCRQPE
jgi:uncharacterized Zn finger protein (UPF0148 family)